jgi:hypothetical protein
MLTAYFDESEVGKKLCVVGGFVSTSEKWVRFAEECERIKVEYSVPFIHTVKLLSPQSSRIYGHLSMDRRLDLCRSLKEAIIRWTEHSVLSTVVPRTYDALTTCEWRSQNKTYYAASFSWILIALEELFCEEEEKEEAVTIFFEAGHRHAGEVENMLRHYKLFSDIERGVMRPPNEPLPLKLGGYGRLTKEIAPPLWAADLISYCFTRSVAYKDAFCREILEDIAVQVPSVGIGIDEEKIELMKRVASSVVEQNKQFRKDMHEMTRTLQRFGVRAVKDKRGIMFDFEHMTLEEKKRFMETEWANQ